MRVGKKGGHQDLENGGGRVSGRGWGVVVGDW